MSKKFEGVLDPNPRMQETCRYCGTVLMLYGSLGGYVHADTEKPECAIRGGTFAMPSGYVVLSNATTSTMPTDAAARKNLPLCTGVFDYFPDALLEVAAVSKIGNDQHNPGQPLHWAKEKSQDEADALARHLLQRGTRDIDGARHSAKIAWRALALLQREIDAERNQVNNETVDNKVTVASTPDSHQPWKRWNSKE